MKKLLIAGAGLLAVCTIMTFGVQIGAALAQTATTPATDTTNVAIPIGTWIANIATTLTMLTVPLVGFMFRRLPSQWANMLMAARVDQLLTQAINYGINATAGASKDKVLTVPAANSVLAHAAQYAVDNAPSLVNLAGGTDLIVKKIIARLEVDAAAGVAAGAAATAAPLQFTSPSQ